MCAMTPQDKQKCVDELQSRSDRIFKHAQQSGGGAAAIEAAMLRELDLMLSSGPLVTLPQRREIIEDLKLLPPFKQQFPE